MNHLSEQRKADKSVAWKNIVAGGCVFGFLIPVIVATTAVCALEITAGAKSPSPFPGYFGDVLMFILYFVSFFVPAILLGVFMGFLGTRFSRGKTVFYGVVACLVLNFSFLAGIIDSEFARPAVVIIPSAGILSWWLHGWIGKRAARHT